MESVAEKGERVDGFVLAGLQHRTDDRLRLAAVVRAIAAPDFAVHDRRFQRLLCSVIRRGDGRIHQE